MLNSSCASQPVSREPTRAELAQLDIRLGTELSEGLEAMLPLEKRPEITVFLREIGVRLTEKSEELRSSPLGVQLFKRAHDAGVADVPILSIPGVRIYLSTEYLKTVETESELAGALAVELARVSLRQVPKRLQAISATSPDSPAVVDIRVFRPVEAELVEAVPRAVELLYRTGYDPRGLVEYWKRWRTEEITAIPEGGANRLIRETYRAIARYTPLRNPVVRSQEFLRLKQRIAGI
ncbi:MAG: hypothetical protein IT285_01025 [Bdellovibrionales bacterium]|nr:hypothetical protein [Bdellovibrionales bacterium]